MATAILVDGQNLLAVRGKGDLLDLTGLRRDHCVVVPRALTGRAQGAGRGPQPHQERSSRPTVWSWVQRLTHQAQ